MKDKVPTQMEDGIKFAKEHIVELAQLIVEWQKTALLNNGSHCLVHDLAKILPGIGSKLPLAESIIKNECLEIVANTKADTNVVDILTECQTLFNDFNASWRIMNTEEKLAYMTKTFKVCDRIEVYKKEHV
jgi:hypothetical protein